jgi:hypothetical protein
LAGERATGPLHCRDRNVDRQVRQRLVADPEDVLNKSPVDDEAADPKAGG